MEAGGQVPDRNIERLLRNLHVPVPPDDLRRLDLIVPGLNVSRGRPLFCDATVLSPLTRLADLEAVQATNGDAYFNMRQQITPIITARFLKLD